MGFDYLTHSPVSKGFGNLLIVVDHVTRMAHLQPCTMRVTREETANFNLLGVYRLHGLPRVLVNDRDPKIVNGLWPTLYRRPETRLNMSCNRHPETDELTERVNSTFQQHVRCSCCYDGSKWTNMLPQVEFAYNVARSLGIEHTPFEAKLGFHLRSHLT
jgi:hypothetical protein